MSLDNVFSPFKPYQENGWLVVPSQKRKDARVILERDFWDTSNPFEQTAYRKIEFPLKVATLSDKSMQAVYGSPEYKNIETEKTDRYNNTFRVKLPANHHHDIEAFNYFLKLQSLPTFLAGVFWEFMAADYLIYKDKSISWSFDIDIARLNRGSVHRRSSTKYHIDGPEGIYNDRTGLINAGFIAAAAADFRKGQVNSSFGGNGMSRIYTSSTVIQTDFLGRSPFQPLDIIHFYVEKHGSPEIPEDCIRFFVRGTAIPRFV